MVWEAKNKQVASPNTRYLACVEQDQAIYSKTELFLKQLLIHFQTLVETELAEIMMLPVIMPLDLIRMLI